MMHLHYAALFSAESGDASKQTNRPGLRPTGLTVMTNFGAAGALLARHLFGVP
jgi:hypothetical protein